MSSLCVVARTPRAVKILKENTEQLLFTKCFMGRTYLVAILFRVFTVNKIDAVFKADTTVMDV